MKADHGDEVGFVFGGPFLAGDIQLRSKEQTPFPHEWVLEPWHYSIQCYQIEVHILAVRPNHNPFSWQNWFYTFNIIFSPEHFARSEAQKIPHLVSNSANRTFARKFTVVIPPLCMNWPNSIGWKWNWRRGQLNLQSAWEAGNPGSLIFLRSLGQCLSSPGIPVGCQASENGGLGHFCRKWCSEQGLAFQCFIFYVKIWWLGLFCLTIQQYLSIYSNRTSPLRED